MDQSEIFQDGTVRPKQQQVYRKIKVLGQGSMGKAYLVQSNKDNQYYVMKRINIGHLSPEQQEIAMREAQLHALVQHPNIIAFKEIYHTTKDKLCIIMEYAQNGDLDKFVQEYNGKSIPEEVVLHYFVQICMGLREIHSKKIIHRDIKGANVFLSKDKVVKIGDFGISKIIDQTVQASKSFVGTPYYLSPEMVEGKPYSTKADIWSLGVLLYHMCAQKLPFDAQSLPLLALKILRGAFPPINGPYSRDLKNLILSMLQVDAKKRPTATQVLMKPLLKKYLPAQQAEKLTALKQPQRIPKNSTVPNITNGLADQNTQITGQTVKPAKKTSKSKNIQEKVLKEKEEKEERKRKRDEQIKEMREDIRKKRLQAQKQKAGSTKTIEQTLVPQNTPNINKIPSKKGIPFQKSPNKQKIEQQQIKQPIQKPWKMKHKGPIKKDIQVQILVPTIKPKQPKKQPQVQPQIDFPIQIKEFGKRPPPVALIEGLNDFGKKQNVEEQHGQNQNEESIQQECESLEEPEEQQETQQPEGSYQDMLNQLNLAQQTVKGLKLKTNKKIQLYEESANFDEQNEKDKVAFKKKTFQLPEMNTMEEDTLRFVHNMGRYNAEALQQGRQIVQDGLGQQKFLKAYNILKDHLQYSEEKKMRGQQLQDYTFNRKVLREKLDFLTDKEFEDYVVWMYTLLLIQMQEMKKNFEN